MKKAFIIPFVIVSLLAAIWTGWVRIGWQWPLSAAAGHHGALMVGSFLSSLIFLERAITFRQQWVLLLPLVNALSGVGFVFKQPLLAQVFLLTGSLGFLVMCVYFVYKYRELYYYVFLAGALSLAIGYVVLLQSHLYPAAVPWWMAFLLFTIVGERLELSRFLALNKFRQTALLLLLAMVMTGLFLPFHGWGKYVFPLAVTGVAAWLLRYDMAWRSIHIKGQHRYSALLLITGYVWLVVTGMLLAFSDQWAFGYDAALHSFFIGFTFPMIFSHAPIIFPAVIKLPLKLYRPVLYAWFAFLQGSLILRLYGGLSGNFYLRKLGGLLNGLAILVFFISIAFIVKLEMEKRKRRLL